MKKGIVVSISSDIGMKIGENWANEGISIYGSYRTMNDELSNLKNQYNWELHQCDLSEASSCNHFLSNYSSSNSLGWDFLVFSTGSQEPVGAFQTVGFDDWSKSIQVNAINQLRLLHGLLPHRNLVNGARPIVYFFAGAGSNNAPKNYSAYIASKIFLTKMTELLASEINDTSFVIVGPGWVKTKIHKATLLAGPEFAGENFATTHAKLISDECTDINKVIKTFNWIRSVPDKAINGKNFSVVFDNIESENIITKLMSDPDMYKLRRNGNDWRG